MYNNQMLDKGLRSPIWGHLLELRKRLIFGLVGFVAFVAVSFIFADKVISYLAGPIGGIENLQAIEVTESLNVYVRVALLCGFILALPWMLVQLLIFVLPGLTTKEKSWIFIFVPLATLFFLCGVVFAFYIMMPPALEFMTEFLGIDTNVRLKNYIDFVTNLLFWVGICFEAPLIVFLLAKLRIVNAKMLLKGWRIAIVVIAILAAVITPTGDPVNMALLMAPLLVLYMLSILMAKVANKSNESKIGV
jgi:sec-independent protein translocase protein TatC